MEIRMCTKSGATRNVLVSVSRMSIAHQQQLVFLIYDITDRKVIEQQAIELAIEHEKTRILNDFIHDVSRDFRTSLTILKLNVFLIKQMVSKLGNPLDVQPDLTTANNIPAPPTSELELALIITSLQNKLITHSKNIERVNMLFEDLLKMSELDSGSAFEFRPHNLNNLVPDDAPRRRGFVRLNQTKPGQSTGYTPQQNSGVFSTRVY